MFLKKIIFSLTVTFFLNKNLTAQAFPMYREVKFKTEKFLHAAKTTGEKVVPLMGLSALVLSPLSYMSCMRFEDIPLEVIQGDGLGAHELPSQEADSGISLEEGLEEGIQDDVSLKKLFSLVMGTVVVGYFTAFLGSKLVTQSTNAKLKVNYLIEKEQEGLSCRGMEELDTLPNAKTDWKHLEKLCSIKPGEAYFLKITDIRGNIVMDGKRIISQLI